MIKKYKTKDTSTYSKCLIVVNTFFQGCSETEVKILSKLIEYSSGNALTITADISNQIKQSEGISDSSFNTCLFRLSKKGIVIRSGKTITIHPALNNIEKAESIMITFSAE